MSERFDTVVCEVEVWAGWLADRVAAAKESAEGARS
jgi:hypothetical protein